MKKIALLLGILIMSVALLSCVQKKVAPLINDGPITIDDMKATTEEPWQIEWSKTLNEAKKEGKIVIYGTIGQETRQALTDGFYARTGIALDITLARSAELSAKILTEHRNNLYIADVYVGATTTPLTVLKPAGVLAPLEPILFLPEVIDPKLWHGNALPWLDKDHLIVVTKGTPAGYLDAAFMKNTVDRNEIASWNDLLKPELKGKMSLQDPTVIGRGSAWVNSAITYYSLNWDYMKSLAKQEPVIMRDQRLQIEWLVHGRQILAIRPDGNTTDDFRTAGVPIEYINFKETKGLLGGASSGIALINRAPHQNSAKLFINWFLSKEGQTFFSRGEAFQSIRLDVPVDHLALTPERIRDPNMSYALITEDFVLQEEKIMPDIIAIFGPLTK